MLTNWINEEGKLWENIVICEKLRQTQEIWERLRKD